MKFIPTALLLAFLVGCSATTINPADIEKRQSRQFDYSSGTVATAILNYHRSRGWQCDTAGKVIICVEQSRSASIYEYEVEEKVSGKSVVRLVIRRGGGILETQITQVVFNGIEKQILRDSAPFVPRTVK